MQMEFEISDFVTIWQKYNPFELSTFDPLTGCLDETPELMLARMLGYNPTRIRIKNDWHDVLPLHQVARSTSSIDGGFHFLYIQINLNTNEYYIGKVNRKRWSEIKRYQGSGLKFKGKYKGHENEFVRYFIACCSTAKQTEELEAAIVDTELLQDPKCLNLVSGGGGTSEHYSRDKRVAHQRQFMKAHPEQFQSMIEVAKQLYQSGDSPQLRQRSKAIKATMSDDHYREMMSERILRWQHEHPEEYQRSRENNRKAQQKPEVKEKKKQARQKWVEEHPEEHRAMQKKLSLARNSPEARKKRSESLKAWAEANPEEAKANAKKRSAASVAKSSKPVNMCDLETGEVIRTFTSQHEAAQWLVDNGLAKNTNCVSSINGVCQRKPCTTGYGYRKKAYGYDWQYAEKEPETSN